MVTTFRGALRGLGWAAVGLLVAVFVIGYAAPYLSPVRFWWADLFALLLPPVSVGVGAGALGVAGMGLWRRQWGRAGVSIVLVVLIALRFGPRVGAWGGSTPAEEGLRVMTFNVPHASIQEKASAEAVAQVVGRTAPDVLAVQESFVRTPDRPSSQLQQASPTLRPLLGGMDYAPARTLPLEMVVQQPVLGRVALDSMEVHALPPSGDTEARSRFTRTHFTWRGRSVVLYNVHLHTVGAVDPWEQLEESGGSVAALRAALRSYREGALRRAQQARLIRRMIERETQPVLVAGDFNSTRHQWAYQHIAQGLQNALTRHGRGWNGTFPAQYPLVQIDHVLAGPAWTVESAQAPALGDHGAASDHRPVVVQLEWRDETLSE